ncbi:hypothetical protein IHE51_01940 [Candidatus Parvarchaeota archaeon]|uniref:Uncharacterized protein n=1 Tax=Candidatus Acidifodinimicrobium mancum TaxID=2898728 RepID=A0A8T3V2E1_9ARCH|nr:hypothetical protein [Candidatus Acidifodinimicrobium mancum]MBE5728790.1 hypothetical protein [Candidatus Acidifodinimicrobium mancum]
MVEKLKKIVCSIVLAVLVPLLLLSTMQISYGMCPLCIAGAAVGLSLARYYGLSDIIVGLWLGALAVSTGVWLARLTRRKLGKRIPAQTPIVFSLVFASTVIPFYLAGFFNGMPGMSDAVFGINKLLFGLVLGSVITYMGAPVSNKIKKTVGKSFPYQTILLTLSLLALFSFLFWYGGV